MTRWSDWFILGFEIKVTYFGVWKKKKSWNGNCKFMGYNNLVSYTELVACPDGTHTTNAHPTICSIRAWKASLESGNETNNNLAIDMIEKHIFKYLWYFPNTNVYHLLFMYVIKQQVLRKTTKNVVIVSLSPPGASTYSTVLLLNVWRCQRF